MAVTTRRRRRRKVKAASPSNTTMPTYTAFTAPTVVETPSPPRRKARVRKTLLTPDLPPYIRRILRKRVSKLTPKEKAELIAWYIQVKGLYSLKQDMARKSRHIARYVVSWLKNPSKSDIPGVDTPEGKELLRRAYAFLRKLGIKY